MKVLAISNHHRRSFYFEETMKLIHGLGIRSYIQDTGVEAWGKYQGPCTYYKNSGTLSYDKGLVRFKDLLVPVLDSSIDTILLIDNDCFVRNTSAITKFVEDFIVDGYDFSSHLVDWRAYKNREYNKTVISPVVDQTFVPCKDPPGFTPVPHWENAFLLIKRELWEELSHDDLSHSRKMFRSIHRKGAKMGAHQASHRLRFSHFGEGWFHVGNLMAYYYALSRGNAARFSLESELDLSRAGHFFAQMNRFGDNIYPAQATETLSRLPREESLAAWNRLTKETCMEGW